MINVYNDIYSLGHSAFEPDNLSQIHLVLNETFKRVAFNLNIIHHELVKIDYKFVADIKYDWQNPVLAPGPNVDFLLEELKLKIKNSGQIPLSLEFFLRLWDHAISVGIGKHILTSCGKALIQ